MRVTSARFQHAALRQVSAAARRGGVLVALTPTADTNRIGCHDPLSDVCALFLQLSDDIRQLCGVF